MNVKASFIVLIGIIAFWNAMHVPFILDDRNAIVENHTIESLALPGPLNPPPDTPVARRPLVNLSFALNYAAGGHDVTGYHIVNLAIHVLAALVLFALVRRVLLLADRSHEPLPPRGGGPLPREPETTRRGPERTLRGHETRQRGHGPARRGSFASTGDSETRARVRQPWWSAEFGNAATSLAWVAALVWLLHPLNSEVVDYVTQRTESMAGLAVLLTMYCAVHAVPGGAVSIRRAGAVSGGASPVRPAETTRWEALAIVSCLAGVLCKESAVTAPVLVLLFDRVFLFDSMRAAWSSRWRLYAGLGASWVLLAAVMWWSPRTSAGFGSGVSSLTYALNQVELIPRYLWLAIWPHALVVDYGVPRALTVTSVLLPAVVLLAVLAGVVVLLLRVPRLGCAAAWFVITLAPTSSIVPIATEVGAERRMYLPLAGLVVLVVVSAYLLLRQRGWHRTAVTRGVMVAVVVALAAGTILRNREYASERTLAQITVDRWPSGRAHFTLGMLLDADGQREDAAAHFATAAADFPGGHYGLGIERVADGRLDEGITELREFIRLAPRDPAVPAARDLIGRALMDRGDLTGAAQEFEQMLRDDPRNVRAHVFLADVRARQGRLDEAIAGYQAARAIDPNVGRDPGVMARLGAAQATAGRMADVVKTFQEASAANPGDAGLQKMLGRGLAASGRFTEAIDAFERAVALAPGDAEARQLLEAASATARVN